VAKKKTIVGKPKTTKPQPFEKLKDGVIGPKNRQDYGKKKSRR
jgi:hypothetical protein